MFCVICILGSHVLVLFVFCGSFAGTRERAVLNAYMSAGAARGIAKACKASELGCTCDTSRTTFVGGATYLHSCGEDVAFAIKFLKGFLTSIVGFFTFCSNCSHGPSTILSNATVPNAPVSTALSSSPIPTPAPTSSASKCGPNCCKLAVDVHNDRVGYEVRKELFMIPPSLSLPPLSLLPLSLSLLLPLSPHSLSPLVSFVPLSLYLTFLSINTVYHEILASENIKRISLQELISIFSVFKFSEQHHHHPY